MIIEEKDKVIIRETIFSHLDWMHGKGIYVFGCTPYVKFIKDTLIGFGLNLTGIVDNNSDKVREGTCVGVGVYSPYNALVPYNDNLIVIICSKYQYEMAMQLKSYGYEEKNVLTVKIEEAILCNGDDIKDMEKSLESVKRGYEIYQSLASTYGMDATFLLCPYPGTGDVYMACLYMPQYIKENNIHKYAVVVIGNKCKRVCYLFELSNVICLDKIEVNQVMRAWEFLGSDIVKIKPLLYWGWRCKRFLYADKYPQITFNEMFVYDVFDLKEDIKHLPVKRKHNEFVEQVFKDYKLAPGKTVLLAPYAGSFVSEISLDIWEHIAYVLQRKGYSVCTNCFGEFEKPVSGTCELALSYQNIIDFLDSAGYFIGLRSGLCDIVSSSKAKLIVLYECGINASKYEYFSLSKMGLVPSDRVEEFKYMGDEEVFCNEICSLFNE